MAEDQLQKAGRLSIWAFCLAYWRNESEARSRLQNNREDSSNSHPLIGLSAWRDRMKKLFAPSHLFFASGSWSDPRFNWVDGVAVVNAGDYPPKEHEGHFHHLAKAAFTAAFAYSLNRVYEWDLLIAMDSDALFGAVDLNSLIREFWIRPEILCAPGWGNVPGGPMQIFKREAVSRLLHNRENSNFRDPEDQSSQSLWELEMNYIFRPMVNGFPRWWNPFPDHFSLIYDPVPEALNWPQVSKFGGGTEFAKRYSEKNCPLTIPYLRDPVKC